MKIVCACGNEAEFEAIEHENLSDEEGSDFFKAQYTKLNERGFVLNSYHGDEKVLECKQCDKRIWFY